jgi:hypothetical protein
MATGDLIRAVDYTALRDRVREILGGGTGNRGYGQKLNSDDFTVVSNDEITFDHWNALRKDIINIKLHQDGIVPNIAPVTTTDPIRYGASFPITNFGTILDQALVNRFSLGDTRASITSKGSNNTTTPWTERAQCTFRVEFNGYTRSEDGVNVTPSAHARYFFNAGGKIRFRSTREGGSTTLQNNSWSTLLVGVGTVEFGGNVPSARSFYDLTSEYQPIYQKTASSPYNSNRFIIEARTPNVLNNFLGDASYIEFRFTWDDLYVDPGPTGPVDAVDGTLTLFAEEVLPVGPLQTDRELDIRGPTYFFDTFATAGTPTTIIPTGAVEFTSGTNQLWEVPEGVFRVKATLVGGGGGGGYSNRNASGATAQYGGGGGGSGGYREQSFNVTPGTNLTFTVGVGGLGAPRNPNASDAPGSTSLLLSEVSGTPGTATTLTVPGLVTYTATGGAAGGNANRAARTAGTGGPGGTPGGTAGGAGTVAPNSSIVSPSTVAGTATGGIGGSNPLGVGGARSFAQGNNGTGRGAGGSGAGVQQISNSTIEAAYGGGNGTNGFLRFEWGEDI